MSSIRPLSVDKQTLGTQSFTPYRLQRLCLLLLATGRPRLRPRRKGLVPTAISWLANVVGPRHISLRFARSKALNGLLALVRSQAGRPAETSRRGPWRGSVPSPRASLDQLALELGKAGQAP